LQYFRSTGEFDWTYDQTAVNQPEDKIPQIFNLMSADEYSSYLEGHEIVSGFPPMDGFHIASVRTWSSESRHKSWPRKRYAARASTHCSTSRGIRASLCPETSSMINITTLLKGGATSIEIETSRSVGVGRRSTLFPT
jgi:hypothetical protein